MVSKLYAKLNLSWENLFTSKASTFVRIARQMLIALCGIGLLALTHHFTQIYTSATTILTVVFISIFGEAISSFLFACALALIADYYFIPPIGSVFDNRESFEHFLIVASVAIIVNVFISSLRLSFRKTIREKRNAERAERDAERSADAMERMLALVSHDIRNPLTSIKLSAQMIPRFKDQPEKIEFFTSKMIEGLDRVDSMIQSLLDVSRVRAGQVIPLDFTYCDLNEILSRTIGDLSLGATDKFTLLKHEPIFGVWSSDGLRRAIENLATNAVKYGNPNSKVNVFLNRQADWVTISVHNFGNPIAIDEQSTLFDSFRRASTSNHSKGWGLGLAMVKGIAEAHTGKVQVESDEERGTTFSLILPIKSESSMASLHNSTTVKKNSFHNISL